MLAAVKKHGRPVQIGQWQRSQQHFADAVAFVRSGQLGNIRLVKAWAYQGWMKPVNVQPDQSAPAGVDYKMWLGPAPERPFNPNRFHFNFRWFWDYAGGLMTDWGVRSEEHTSELQSLTRISYAVFCLKKKNNNLKTTENKTM